KFTYLYVLWLWHPEQLTELSLDLDYNPTKHFDSLQGRLQGQLCDLHDLFPSRLHREFANSMFWKEFKRQVQQQHSNGITRIRIEAGASIFDCKSEELVSSFERVKFRKEIGFVEEEDGTTWYKILCPILYKDYEGKHNKRKIFLNPTLFNACYALSVDHQLQPVGSSTNICYQDDLEYYLNYLHWGLQKEDRHVKAIFQNWNDHFYPN
ncbi:hypothetical protein M422DRAFT_124611, partial [Sphaerobolus stellatus SS14]